jgi:hypothetical protein
MTVAGRPPPRGLRIAWNAYNYRGQHVGAFSSAGHLGAKVFHETPSGARTDERLGAVGGGVLRALSERRQIDQRLTQ